MSFQLSYIRPKGATAEARRGPGMPWRRAAWGVAAASALMAGLATTAAPGGAAVIGPAARSQVQPSSERLAAAGVAALVAEAHLTASDQAAKDFVGSSVAISGNTVVVGAPASYWPGSPNAKATSDPGAVYVYQKGEHGWADMTQTAKLTAHDGAANGFGWSVAITGNTIVVGAPSPQSVSNPCGSGTRYGNPGAPGDPGAVYVFTLNAGRWPDFKAHRGR